MPRGIKVTVNEDFFENIDNERKAYWLGFISADGCNHESGKVVSMALQARDKEHLEKFLRDIESSGKVRDYTSKSHVSVTSAKFAGNLNKWGVTPRKSRTLAPWEGFLGPLSRHYWRGFVDGDGCLCRTPQNNGWSISLVGSQKIVFSFTQWAKTLVEFSAKPRVRIAPYCWEVTIGGRLKSRKIIEALYGRCEVSLQRKQALANEILVLSPESLVFAPNLIESLPMGEIVRDYLNHQSLTTIAKSHGVSSETIANKLRRAGITLRSNTGHCASRIPIEVISAEYLAGVSSEKIAEAHNVDGQTVCRALRRAGIEIRGRHNSRLKKSLIDL